MMFGLALTTTTAYVAIDTGFASGETPEYRRWAIRSPRSQHGRNIWVAGMGSWYFFGALSAEVRVQLPRP
jgi:hypothetical protein